MKQTRKADKRRNKRESMGSDPIWTLLFRFSGPAIISMTVASTYNLVDAIFVGRLGSTSLAALSVTFPLVLSFIALASGTAVGTTSLISRSLGAGDRGNADRAACVAITLCFLLSIIIAVICLPNLDTLLNSLGAGDTVLHLAKKYLSIVIYGNVFANLSLILASIIRADGNPLFSSSVSIAAAITNIILDPLLIFGLGPIPAMGISGAATATVIARAMSTAVYLVYILAGRTGYRFIPDNFFPRLKVIGGIYRIGIAAIIRSGVQFVVMGVVNRIAASFGLSALAIIGVLVRVGRFVQMPTLGLGQGMIPLIGYNHGAQRKERIAELVFKAALAGVVWTGLCWLIIMLFPAQVISAFNTEPAFLEEGTYAARLYFMFIFMLGIQMVPSFFFQGIGKGLPATILSAARYIFFLLPLILVMPRFYGLTGLWLSFPIADILALMLAVIWAVSDFYKQKISFNECR